MNNPDNLAENEPSEFVMPRSYRVVRRLAWLYAAMIGGWIILLAASWLPAAWLPRVRALAAEMIAGGLGAVVLAALLLALAALLGILAIAAARFEHANATDGERMAARRRWSFVDPGFGARQMQALIMPTGAVLALIVLRVLWPAGTTVASAAAVNIAAAFVFALAFLSLVAERVMREFPQPQLPEAPALRRTLLLTTLVLGLTACAEIGRGVSLGWIRWAQIALMLVPVMALCELAIRALARLFLPRPAAASATAVADSFIVSLLTGGSRSPGVLLRTHLGLDFARSWALAYLSAAILPALFATALVCWGLSGLKLINLGERGVYERFGAPVAVLGPGLHLLLPWPLGRLRPVEYGTIHSVAVGVENPGPSIESAKIPAEAVPPVSLNRLWETSHADQAHYLVPSPGTGPQGFQSVATEIHVLYRVGLTDEDALRSVYALADPEALIRDDASRLVLRYFSSRTLEQVIGAERENVADNLRAALTADMQSHGSGIEIVSVLIEEVHPPAGAAAAYHAVQAAQINADASIYNEQGRAERTAGIAAQEAHRLVTSATAKAAEILHAANAAAYRFKADRGAYDDGGRAFLVERYYGNLDKALSKAPLTLLDYRLKPGQGPIIDLRSATGALGGAPSAAQSTSLIPPVLSGEP